MILKSIQKWMPVVVGLSFFASGAVKAQEVTDLNPLLTGCLIVKQVGANGNLLAANRVCSLPQREFSLFSHYQLGVRPVWNNTPAEVDLVNASLIFTGARSFAQHNDIRYADLLIHERGAYSIQERKTYALRLSTQKETEVELGSGTRLVLKLDPSNKPTAFDTRGQMPVWYVR